MKRLNIQWRGKNPATERVFLKRRTTPLLLSVLAIAMVGFSIISAPVTAQGVGRWTATTSYPTPIIWHSCVVSGDYIYCVGGNPGVSPFVTSAVYFAKLSSSGVAMWARTTSYPTPIYGQSCVVSGGYIYCIAGDTSVSPFETGAVYFAPLSSAGVGAWKSTKSYPVALYGQSCVVSEGYIYCVGGYTNVPPYNQTNAVYFASVSSSGVVAWKKTKSYPVALYGQSCVVSEGYIYCVGAQTTFSPGFTNAVYFASLSSSGVGAWTLTKSYPTNISEVSCVVSGGYIYCVGGFTGFLPYYTSAVYFAKLSSSGVGAWAGTTSYTTTIYDHSCVAGGSHVYCVGGNTPFNTADVYFASIAPYTSSVLSSLRSSSSSSSSSVSSIRIHSGSTNSSSSISSSLFSSLSSAYSSWSSSSTSSSSSSSAFSSAHGGFPFAPVNSDSLASYIMVVLLLLAVPVAFRKTHVSTPSRQSPVNHRSQNNQ